MSQDISPEVIKKTQKTLGKVVKKPPLTEKLLKKPPFRFLHDIVKSVIKETGFLRGLFTEDELKSENVTEKGAKIAFLNKLIDAVKTLTNTELEVKASKIVAGLEPTNTNLLLQCIGKALESNIDSTQYVSHLANGHDAPKKPKTKEITKLKTSSRTNLSKDGDAKRKDDGSSNAKKVKTPKEKTSSRGEKISPPSDKTGTSKESKRKKTESKRKSHEKEAENNEIKSPKQSPNENELKDKTVDELNSTNTTKNDDTTIVSMPIDGPLEELGTREVDSGISITDGPSSTILTKDPEKDVEEQPRNNAPLVRPKSARPKSGERIGQRSAMKEHREEVIKPLEMTSFRSIPKSALLRPPSARPPSARPAAPRLQARPDSALPVGEPVPLGGGVSVIVEGADDNADEEETVVVIEEVGRDLLEGGTSPTDMLGRDVLQNENKGQLVEQILEQIGEEEVKKDAKKTVEVEWETEAAKGGASKEIAQLRNYIQNITKTSSSLGKLMSYLHEDIDSMQSELQMWTNTRKQLITEINKQKKLNDEATKPLIEHLNQLQEEIRKQEQEIIDMENHVQRNDLRIKELLSMK